VTAREMPSGDKVTLRRSRGWIPPGTTGSEYRDLRTSQGLTCLEARACSTSRCRRNVLYFPAVSITISTSFAILSRVRSPEFEM
jgi:hypothetical protein